MKRYIKSDTNTGRQYYAYPMKEVNRIIKDYLYWQYKEGKYFDYNLGVDTIVTEPTYYAFIANSDMTDIDVAFVSKDENIVSKLSWDSEDVRLLLDDEYREETGIEFEDIEKQLAAKGIIVLDDESGSLFHMEDAVLFDAKIEDLIDQCINTYGKKYADDIYDCLMENYGDKVIDDLYVSDKFSNMIIPVEGEHWRF